MTAVRRSGRARKAVESVYDEALKDALERKRRREEESSKAGGGEEAESDEDGHDTEEESLQEDNDGGGNGDDDVGDSSDDDDFEKPAAKKARSAPNKSAAQSKKKGGKGKSKKVQIQLRPNGSLGGPAAPPPSKKALASRSKGPGGHGQRRVLNAALMNLSKKVLEPHEIPPSSLVAGLLHSYRPFEIQSDKSARSRARQRQLASYASPASSQPVTVYTPQLTELARTVVAQHNAGDPNAAQIRLLNLLFRSVGGIPETNLDPAEVTLEDMDSEDWAHAVTDLVDEMRHTPADRILLCADPDGAVHAAAVLEKGEGNAPPPGPSSLGVREYRRIYEEFWYVLGGVALSEGGMASNARAAEAEDEIEESDDEDEEEEEEEEEDESDDDSEIEDEYGETPNSKRKRKKTPTKKKKAKKTTKKKKPRKKSPKKSTFTTTIRFDAELVKDLINRVMELVSVGQPDVRAAATIAAYQMGRAILDKTVLLGNKLEVAQRQYAAATKRGSATVSPSPGKGKGKASAAAGGGGGGRKAESLKHQIDSLKRTRLHLEEVVTNAVVDGVFSHRWRDSNSHIRTFSVRTLTSMMIQRPDLFFVNRYLKYPAWTISDKSEGVRRAALGALCAPFDAVYGRDALDERMADRIDLKALENVVTKFLPRIADCVIDVSPKVQERATKLLLALLREGFLDEVEDEKVWNQINLRALAPDATPLARRDALYFVMEQLEAFDDDDDDDDEEDEDEEAGGAAQKRRRKSASAAKAAANESSESSERRTVQRLDALASWTAHALTDGPIPLDKIRIHLSDLIVLALRDMPEHKHLVTDWAALTRAIGDDRAATTMEGTTAGDRGDVAKQRVLVQMLACAARAEVGDVTDASFMTGDVDPDVVAHQQASEAASAAEGAAAPGPGRGSHHHRKMSTAIQHESLSVALLRTLPSLLVKFKSDSAVLTSLTVLPRYLLPTVFSLPQRKDDFNALAKNLAEVYLSSTDEKVLQNAALSLYYLTEGDHARATDAKLQLRDVVQELQSRLVELFAEDVSALAKSKKKKKKKKASKDDGDKEPDEDEEEKNGGEDDKDKEEEEAPSRAEETEYALYLNLKRLRVLAKRCDCAQFFSNGEDADASDDNDKSLEALSSVVADGLIARLKTWKVERIPEEDDESRVTRSPSPWDCGHEELASVVAGSVGDGLTVLLTLTAWKLSAVQKELNLVIDDDATAEDVTAPQADAMEEDADDHLIKRMRDRIVALLISCYDQYLDPAAAGAGDDDDDASPFSPEQMAYADSVQESAGRIASDLRTLFPKELKDASSPLLRSLAMEDDGRLLSGYVRYLRSNEALLRSAAASKGTGSKEDADAEKAAVAKLLLPVGRALAFNWTTGNRKEASVVLAHLTGSGEQSHEMVAALSRAFKKIEPVRLLEAQMAALRSGYEAWLENEPEEIQSDRPTDEEMAAYEEAERKHGEQFGRLEALATKFSQSLGVGKLSNPRLSPALLGFVREGVNGAFHSDEEWALGSKLSFLNVLSKYSVWIKKNRTHLRAVERDLEEKGAALRDDPEFGDVHADDLACLEAYHASLGLKLNPANEAAAEAQDAPQPQPESNLVEEEEMNDSVSELMTPATQRTSASRFSRASSAGGRSLRSNLSPLYEDKSTAGGSGSTPEEEDGTRSRSTVPRHAAETPGGYSAMSGLTRSVAPGDASVTSESDRSDLSHSVATRSVATRSVATRSVAPAETPYSERTERTERTRSVAPGEDGASDSERSDLSRSVATRSVATRSVIPAETPHSERTERTRSVAPSGGSEASDSERSGHSRSVATRSFAPAETPQSARSERTNRSVMYDAETPHSARTERTSRSAFTEGETPHSQRSERETPHTERSERTPHSARTGRSSRLVADGETPFSERSERSEGTRYVEEEEGETPRTERSERSEGTRFIEEEGETPHTERSERTPHSERSQRTEGSSVAEGESPHSQRTARTARTAATEEGETPHSARTERTSRSCAEEGETPGSERSHSSAYSEGSPLSRSVAPGRGSPADYSRSVARSEGSPGARSERSDGSRSRLSHGSGGGGGSPARSERSEGSSRSGSARSESPALSERSSRSGGGSVRSGSPRSERSESPASEGHGSRSVVKATQKTVEGEDDFSDGGEEHRRSGLEEGSLDEEEESRYSGVQLE